MRSQVNPDNAAAAGHVDEHAPSHWRMLAETLHADCRVFEVYKRQCVHPDDDRQGEFFVIKSNDWVQVLALTPEQQLILVQQYRFGSGALSWEVPGGVIDATDASPEAAAARELLEETGYRGDTGEVIGWCYPNPAIQSNRTHFVLIRNCRPVAPPAPDPHEEIAVHTTTPGEAVRMAARGEIRHAIALNALFYLQHVLAGNSDPAQG